MPEKCVIAGCDCAKTDSRSFIRCVNGPSQVGLLTISIWSLSNPKSLLAMYCIWRLITKAEIIKTTQEVYCSTISSFEKRGLTLNALKLLMTATGFIFEMINAG